MTNFEKWKILEFSFNSQPLKDIQLENELLKVPPYVFSYEATMKVIEYAERKRMKISLIHQNDLKVVASKDIVMIVTKT